MDELNNSKICKKCNIEKPFSEFYKRKGLKDGLNLYCKECHKNHYKDAKEKDPEEFEKHVRTYYKENKTRRKIVWENKTDEIEFNKQNIINKTCIRCEQEKPISEFGIKTESNDGFNHTCKTCNNIVTQLYRENNPESHKKSSRLHYKNNKEKFKAKQHIRDKTKHNEHNMKRYYSEPEFRIKKSVGSRIYQLLRKNKSTKFNKSVKYLGCPIKEYREFLENQFLPEMTWDNHGKIWEIDHIIPCDSFDLIIEEEQLKCFHYSNTQPLFKTTEIAESFGYIGYIGNRDKHNTIL